MTIIRLDGIPIRLEAPDLNKDGKKGGIETIEYQPMSGTTQIIQPTELGESLKSLNDDTIETDTRMSGIDMRARLHPIEVGSILCLDALVSLRVLPTRCLAFTRQKKRLSVSIKGKGREEMVNIVAGKREQDAKMAGSGMMDKIKTGLGIGTK